MAAPSPETIVRMIREAGVVGAGGAGFPAHVKANLSASVVVGNGAECEPLLCCDKELMTARPRAIVEGLELLGRAVGAKELVLAVKEKSREALKALEDAAGEGKGIRIHRLGDFYPSGDEVSLVYEVTGRVVPEGGFPPDAGVLVQNVATLAGISDALAGKAFTRRFITVSGEVAEPITLDVPVGTRISTLIEAAGGPCVDPFFVVTGGACMGRLASSLDDPVLKTTTGLLLLPPDHPLVQRMTASIDQLLHRARSVCDQCRFCTDLCPRYLLGHRLEPHRLMTAIGWGNELGAEEVRTAHLCCECGICGIYACPMGLYPNLYIRRIKEELNAAGLKRGRGLSPEKPRPEYRDRKLPLPRLRSRLDLNRYSDKAPLAGTPVDPMEVRLLLKQHTGAPAKAVVAPGLVVAAGDLVGEIPGDVLGARVHASISGQVAEVTEEWVIIRKTVP